VPTLIVSYCLIIIYLRPTQKVVVFGATNRPQDVDAAVHRRFERSILIPPPDHTDRSDIFKAIFTNNLIPMEPGFNYEICADLTDGYSASDILAVCKTTISSVQREKIYKNIRGERALDFIDKGWDGAMSTWRWTPLPTLISCFL